MSKTPKNQNGHAATDGQAKSNGQPCKKSRLKADQQEDAATLIDQATAVHMSLRETLRKTTELVKALKRYRRQSRIVQSTITSLRQLKTLGI